MTAELRRMHRVADLLVTCHCILRDRLSRLALALDLCLLVGSLLVSVLALGSAEAKHWLLAGFMRTDTGIGLLGLAIFALSIVSIRVNWANRSALHGETAKTFAALKLEAAELLANPASRTQGRFDTLQAEYKMAGTNAIPVPEREFNRLKKKHLTKVALSRLLDVKPGASLLVARIKLWWRDSF